MIFKLDLQYFGGRGSSSSGGGDGLKDLNPNPNGGGGEGNWSQFPNTMQPDTMNEALGTRGKPMSMTDAALAANPYYDGSYREFSENCQRAVVAYEARRRGYDVTAQPTYEGDNLPKTAHINKDGSVNGYWMGAFKGAKSENVGASTPKAVENNVKNTMAGYGDGSRAILSFGWKGSGGHVVNVEYKNGKVHYLDAQVGGKYTPNKLFNAIKTGSANLIRTDNLQFSSRVTKSVEQSGSRTNRK